jgi:hypothetical protein
LADVLSVVPGSSLRSKLTLAVEVVAENGFLQNRMPLILDPSVMPGLNI